MVENEKAARAAIAERKKRSTNSPRYRTKQSRVKERLARQTSVSPGGKLHKKQPTSDDARNGHGRHRDETSSDDSDEDAVDHFAKRVSSNNKSSSSSSSSDGEEDKEEDDEEAPSQEDKEEDDDEPKEDQEPEPECRICREECPAASMISPCACRGSIRYVHPRCLHAWRHSDHRRTLRCSVCGLQYIYIRVPSQLEMLSIMLRSATVGQLVTLAKGAWHHVARRDCDHLCCAVVRLFHLAALLVVSLLQARLFGVIFVQAVQLVVQVDVTLDQMILPEVVAGLTR